MNILTGLLKICLLNAFLLLFVFSEEQVSKSYEKDSKKIEQAKAVYNKAYDSFVKVYNDSDIVFYIDETAYKFSEIKYLFSLMLKNHAKLYPELEITGEKALELKRSAINKVVQQKLIKQEIERLNLYPPDEEVEADYKKFKARFHSEKHFEVFTSMNHSSVSAYKEQLRYNIAVRNLFHKFDEEIKKPDSSEISRWYEQNKSYFSVPRKIQLKLIQIDNNDEEKNTAEKNYALINKIRSDIIDNKKTFEFYAGNFSDDPASRKKGGDCEIIINDKLPEKFFQFKKMTDLKPDQIIPVLRYDKGFYFAKIISDTPAYIKELKDVSAEIEKILYNLKRKNNQVKHIQELKSRHPVKIL